MYQEFIFPHAATVVPPAGSCAPYSAFHEVLHQLRSFSDAECETLLKQQLSSWRTLSDVKLYQSGKAALYQAFLALAQVSDKRRIAVAAYTCPDIAAAAVRAGFTVHPLDVDPASTQPSKKELDDVLTQSDLIAVVLSNLYGCADPIPEQLLTRRHDVLIIDDACQAAYTKRQTRFLGSLSDTLGVVSFGRGKAIAGIGGGALLLPQNCNSNSLAHKVWQALLHTTELENSTKTRDIAQSLLQWSFSAPQYYRIPASIPWLGLGETHCTLEFPIGSMSRWKVLHAIAQLRRRERVQEILRSNSRRWLDALDSCRFGSISYPKQSPKNVYTRFPLFFERIADRSTFLRHAHRRGLGISASYPAPLPAFAALHAGLESRPCLEAERMARTLVTLPIHSYVTPKHIEQGIQLLKELQS